MLLVAIVAVSVCSSRWPNAMEVAVCVAGLVCRLPLSAWLQDCCDDIERALVALLLCTDKYA
jgi:hypothetical protein